MGIENKDINYLIRKAFLEEELKDQNKYFCAKCNDHTEAIRKMGIHKLPNYFIIILNRFFYNFATQKRNKIMKEVDVPLMIDFKNYCLYLNEMNQIDGRFELYSVVIHRVILIFYNLK